MSEIKLTKRIKYAGDVHAELLKAGFDCETAALFCNNIPDADAVEVVRCRNCRYSKDGYVCARKVKNGGRVDRVDPSFFCAAGKRRDE